MGVARMGSKIQGQGRDKEGSKRGLGFGELHSIWSPQVFHLTNSPSPPFNTCYFPYLYQT